MSKEEPKREPYSSDNDPVEDEPASIDIQSIDNLYKSAMNVYHNPILANLATSQAILESGLPNNPSKLAIEGKNLFGIKGKGTDGSIKLLTWEYIDNEDIRVYADFAKNKTYEDSFRQHYNLMHKPRYAKVLKSNTLEEAARAVHTAGYATDPNYSTKLIHIYYEYLT